MEEREARSVPRSRLGGGMLVPLDIEELLVSLAQG